MDGWSCSAGCEATGLVLRAAPVEFDDADWHVIWRVFCNGKGRHEWVPTAGTTIIIEPEGISARPA